MSKKLAEGLDALVLDVKVGAGAFMKRQVDARRLAQMMVGIGRRMDKRVQALITDMNQPLGFAVGNALEVMEVSQTLQNAGPVDLTRLSLELAARMIFLGKARTLDEARESPSALLDGSGYRKFKEVIQAQGGDPQVLDRSTCCRTPPAPARSPPAQRLHQRHRRRGYRRASTMIGAGRDTKDDTSTPPSASSSKSRSARRSMPARCSAASTTPAKTGRRSRRAGRGRLPHLQSAARERELILEVVS
jgi:pyrimidine-nucleoside phosphorylase